MPCNNNLILQNSDNLTFGESNCQHSPLKCSNYKENIFAEHQESSIDTSFLSPTVWNQSNVIEEIYFDPRLYNNRLAILNQERLYFK